jgi:hypothetical protein
MPQLISTAPTTKATVKAKPVWIERTLIFRPSGGRVVAVDGWVFGMLAFHPTWSHPDLPKVTITHLPSKLSLAWLPDDGEAEASVEWLWEQCPELWTQEDVLPLKGKFPAQVVSWCRERQIPSKEIKR